MRSFAPWVPLVLALIGHASAFQAQDLLRELIAERTQGGVAYRTGGVGAEERKALEQVSGDYNVKLVFAEKGSLAFVADVRVRIAKPSAETVLEAMAEGPWFFVRLAPGTWEVTATAKGSAQTQTAKVPETGQAELRFYW